MHLGGFVVLDFGSQYTQLIARRLRELGYYSELLAYDVSLDEISARKPAGIILSGGPSSVSDSDAPIRDVKELLDVAPLLGVCFGMQLLAHQLGGEVTVASQKEYGLKTVHWKSEIQGVPKAQKVWMSHGDIISKLPPGFSLVARTDNHPAAMRSDRAWGIQFHPEVSHTEKGDLILREFAEKFCRAEENWNSPHIAEMLIQGIQEKVPDGDHVLCALSGGVDSTVVGTLLTKALGSERVHCVFVDNGLLRKNEFQSVLKMYAELGLNVNGVDASEKFMKALAGVSDPEEKRKKIGHLFIAIFKGEIPENSQLKVVGPGDSISRCD